MPTPQAPPPPSPRPGEPRSILSAWQRPLVTALVLGGIFLAATGLFLVATPGTSPSASAAFVAHLIVGALLTPVLFIFTIPHAVAQTKRKPFIALGGALVLATALALVASGAILVLEPVKKAGSVAWLVHVVAGAALFVLYAVHRRFGGNPASGRSIATGLAATAALGAGLALWETSNPGRVSIFETGSASAAEAARVHFFPSLATTGAGKLTMTAEDIKDVASCARCHKQITQEWQRSAHRHASMTNMFYRASIEDLRKRYPAADSRWCASCHDPALLFTADPKTGEAKMISADLDLDSEDARVGLTCISCHCVDPQSTIGNADYVLRGRKKAPGENSPDPAVRKAHDVLLRLKPEAHVASMTPHNIRESAYCALCHKAQPPAELTRWKQVRAQDEYDSHDDSGVSMGNARSFYHPPAPKSCQDCHMPLVADPDDPAADSEGRVRSHLFAAANTALPHLRGDEDMIKKTLEFLKTSCRVSITGIELSGGRRFYPADVARPAVRPGETVQADVVVRNLGVGHRFPGGTVDSNEVWIDFEARVGDGDVFYASGKIDPETGDVDPSAEFYRSFWLTRKGERFVSRIANDLYTFVYVKRIGPGTADVVRYRFQVPDGAAGELKMKATLRYRKFMMPFVRSVAKTRGGDGLKVKYRNETEYLVEGELRVADLSMLPIADMATGELSLAITAEGTPGPAPAPETLKLKLPEDRERVNDLAIGMLLQGDTGPAREVFEAVTRIDPRYPDGWVNIARVALDLQDPDTAVAACKKAIEVSKANPKAVFFPAKAYFFEAQARRIARDWSGAEALYKLTLVDFPRDREAHRRLADVQYQQGKIQESLATCDSMLKIDAEDWEAWYWAMRCYTDLGDEPRRISAQAAHDKFRLDDDALARGAPTKLDDENLHNLSQPVHVHEQKKAK
jgi:tetratricopeptide (TPR) repeat protein